MTHDDRLETFLENRLQGVIADANAAGWGTQDVLEALDSALKQARRAYREDPDPADDPDPTEKSLSENLDTEEDVPRAG